MAKTKKAKPQPSNSVPAQDDQARETVVMFVDIIGASEVSNHKPPNEYAAFVGSFQEMFSTLCNKYKSAWYSGEGLHDVKVEARGDEGVLMIYNRPAHSPVAADVDVALNIALDLKRNWLCSKANASRIRSGLLPIDLGIGIHAGPTYLVKGSPEGYAINLAKRVEGHSRQGKFSQIFISETAHGHLADLAEEPTYMFDDPQHANMKGISRSPRVYEVKHHFLPTDWDELSVKTIRSKTLVEAADAELFLEALRINPTNLWLAEEYIRSEMLTRYWSLSKKDREDYARLRTAFRGAKLRADMLRQSDQRDAGVMFIQGFVNGECGEFEDEQENYRDALKESDQLDLAHWYLGLSYSMQLYEALSQNLEIPHKDLRADHQALANRALTELERAQSMRPMNAWMKYDFGCELVRWARTADEQARGIDNVVLAVARLPEVEDRIESEPYLQDAHDKTRIKELVRSTNK